MKQTIKTIDGQVFVCTPVNVCKNAGSMTTREFTIPTYVVIEAVEKRMKECIERLLKDIKEDQIVNIFPMGKEAHRDFSVIRSTDGHAFNEYSYQAMEDVIAELKAETTPGELNALFLQELPADMLSQMKKALAGYFQGWTDEVSFVEEIEFYVRHTRHASC